MTRSLKFVLMDEISELDSLDLLNIDGSNSGITLLSNGWQQQVAAQDAEQLEEVFTLSIRGTSINYLAENFQALTAKIEQVENWMRDYGTARYWVMLVTQLENEASERRAQVLGIAGGEILIDVNVQANFEITQYTLTITRTPWWESIAQYLNTTPGNLSVLGGLAPLDPANNIVGGDRPARVVDFSVSPAEAHGLNTLWAGWKSGLYGDPEAFQPNWDMADALFTDDDTNTVSDSSARSGSRLECTFATDATLITRATCRLGTAVSVSDDWPVQRGTYQVLLRAYVDTAPTVVRARIAFSWGTGGTLFDPVYRPRQVIKGVYWAYYDMGTIMIPPMRTLADYVLGNYYIGVDAERLSGVGNLEMDCLTLIPIEEGAIKLVTRAKNVMPGSTLHVWSDPDDRLFSNSETGGNIESRGEVTPLRRWELPRTLNNYQPCVVVAANYIVNVTGTDEPVNDKDDTLDINCTFATRQRALRGESW